MVLYLLTGVSHLTGDLAAAVKLCSIALHAALCGALFAVVRILTRSKWPGVFGAALAAASGPHLYTVVEFVNQLGARHLLRRADLLRHLPALRGRLEPKPIVLNPHGEQFVVHGRSARHPSRRGPKATLTTPSIGCSTTSSEDT